MQRDKDWMVSAGGWTLLPTLSSGDITAVPLTGYLAQDLTTVAAGVPWFESGDNWTLEAVRGSILLLHSEMQPSVTYEQPVHMFLDVLDSDVQGALVLDPLFDAEDPMTANRSFLWHHWNLGINLTTWWTDRPGYGQYEKIDVNVKARRRMEANKIVCLIIQNTLSAVGGRINVYTHLRTLGSKRM